jgi:hypothetical protein
MTIDVIQHVVGYARFTLQYFPLCQPNVTDDQNCSSLYAKIRGIFFFQTYKGLAKWKMSL